ncbi:MAG: hypothetical protein E2O50_05105 [Gammaproteobacteria bacterium]|nr:MAG: hypothetical protein E2O50_05105 [Gammaproteobacteria bacterium]
MRTYPGVMALAIAVITAQLVATPTSAASLKHFKQLPRQSSQSLTKHNFSNHVPMVGPKSPWMGEFTAGNRDHPVFGDRGNLHEYLDELSNDHSDGHRLAMEVGRLGFRFTGGKPKDWLNSKDSKNPGQQTNVVPIPAAVWLMFSALAVLGWRGKKSVDSKTAVEVTEKAVTA